MVTQGEAGLSCHDDHAFVRPARDDSWHAISLLGMMGTPPVQALRGQFKVSRVGAGHDLDTKGNARGSVAGLPEDDAVGATAFDASMKPDRDPLADFRPQCGSAPLQATAPALSPDR